MHDRAKTTGPRRWLTCACVAVVVLATMVQSAHVCGVAQSSGDELEGAGVQAASSAMCPVCAMSHPARAAVMQPQPAPALQAAQRVAAAEPQPYAFLALFALNVRPPPA